MKKLLLIIVATIMLASCGEYSPKLNFCYPVIVTGTQLLSDGSCEYSVINVVPIEYTNGTKSDRNVQRAFSFIYYANSYSLGDTVDVILFSKNLNHSCR